MTECFDPVEAVQRATAILTGHTRAALGGNAQRRIAEIEKQGGTMEVRAWPNGEVAVFVTLNGVVVMGVWVVAHNGFSMLFEVPDAADPTGPASA